MNRRLAFACVTVGAVFPTFVLHGCGKSGEREIVRHKIIGVQQSLPMNCWAAAFAMLVSWKLGVATSERQAVAALGNPWVQYQSEGTGLPGGKELAFVRAAELQAEPPANYTLEAFFQMLSTGPLWIITGDGFSSHARVMAGAVGDRTYDGSTFLFVDPLDASERAVPALTFLAEFEREAAVVVGSKNPVDLRWQILHWPAAAMSPMVPHQSPPGSVALPGS
jgi:hypothetical protein